MIRQLKLAMALLLSAIVVSASPALARTQLPATGGRGDRDQVVSCPPGEMLAGFTGQTGTSTAFD